jgi:oxygen-independent coproporphyrinogen III oxidase
MENLKYLLDKYNAPVPRYTSYPPANHFTDEFTAQDYHQAIIQSNIEGDSNVSFYLHIPFCKRMCYYCGCNSCPMAEQNIVNRYVQALKKEVNLVSEALDSKRKLSQIHYGGGTPNSIDLRYIKELNELIFSKFETIENPEIAIECHPGYLEQGDLELLTQAGFNRFSLGIQDFSDDVLKKSNREPSKIPVGDLISSIKELNPKAKVNLDFIYGLPGQTRESFNNTIRQAAELRPDRIVTFSYAHVPWVNKLQLHLEEIGLPEQNDKIEMYFSSARLLKELGYIQIGFDHYVLPDDELNIAFEQKQLHRNFQGYSTRSTTGQVYAFGVSAISQLESAYSQNTKSIEDYIKILDNNHLPTEKGYQLRQAEKQIGELITYFLCNKELKFDLIANQLELSLIDLMRLLKIDFRSLSEFESDGIIEFSTGTMRVTDIGMLFIRNVAGEFDPIYAGKTNKYSKSV